MTTPHGGGAAGSEEEKVERFQAVISPYIDEGSSVIDTTTGETVWRWNVGAGPVTQADVLVALLNRLTTTPAGVGAGSRRE